MPFSARYVGAAGGIVIGGTMTGATLAGPNLLAGLRARRDEVEARLALGATPRQAVCRRPCSPLSPLPADPSNPRDR